ncbi:MAG TPA: SPOR domain-containing protein [Candidatus Omnitrophota bacterium]|nr:SPOR domain-containing protein [Candidatus Omnitrophota bacterium]
MTINIKEQSQFELFPGNAKHLAPQAIQNRLSIKDLTLSIENIIVLCIVLVMTYVVFFSFGVERGRRLGLAQPAEEAIPAGKIEILAAPQPAELEQTAKPTAQQQLEPNAKEQVLQVPLERELTDEDLFTIQIASFKSETSARKEVERLGNTGHESFVVAKGDYSIVCIGKFAQRDEAKKASSKLKSKYRDLLVRRL